MTQTLLSHAEWYADKEKQNNPDVQTQLFTVGVVPFLSETKIANRKASYLHLKHSALVCIFEVWCRPLRTVTERDREMETEEQNYESSPWPRCSNMLSVWTANVRSTKKQGTNTSP